MPKKNASKTNEDETIYVGFRVSNSTKQRLDMLATKERRSLSKTVSYFLELGLSVAEKNKHFSHAN